MSHEFDMKYGQSSQSPSLEDDSPPSKPLNTSSSTAAAKAKDPSRPKRKKARRACAACQRAHLTCGDERPCERCIKRGLQDDCHDGARKKAKYLRDAPDEALRPGACQYYTHAQSNGSAKSPNMDEPQSIHGESVPPPSRNGFERRQSSINAFSPASTDMHRHSQSHEIPQFNPYGPQSSPMPQFNAAPETPGPAMSTSFQPAFEAGHDFTSAFLDPGDTSLFGYDMSALNFGNQYGALEFVTLGHMAQGANDPMLQRSNSTYDGSNSMQQPGYMNSSAEMGYPYARHNSNTEWQQNDRQMGSWMNHGTEYAETKPEPNTYSIGANHSGASPASTGGTGDFMAPYESTPPDGDKSFAPPKLTRTQSETFRPQAVAPKPEREHRPNKSISRKLEHATPNGQQISQRRRNAHKVYASVIKPYPYTARFHALIAIIQRRFHSTKRLRIAKALASIRPSFISCTRTLIDEDLVLMEKNFQRSLIEYRDHVSAGGTPTIICRRTGEVAYCGESFLHLSGWPVGVLLGKEPNLNVNRGGTDSELASGAMSKSSAGGFTTPRIPYLNVEQPEANGSFVNASSSVPVKSPQAPLSARDKETPVFLSDLLDDDSVIQFYEDFAKIAFADSKGSARRRCKLIKYKTKDDPIFGAGTKESSSSGRKPGRKGGPGEQQDISRLGEDDGMIDCMFTWTVKRDVFEFPMMVVINFLPVLET